MCKVPEVSEESIAASGDTMTKGSGCYQPRSLYMSKNRPSFPFQALSQNLMRNNRPTPTVLKCPLYFDKKTKKCLHACTKINRTQFLSMTTILLCYLHLRAGSPKLEICFHFLQIIGYALNIL